MKRSIRLPKKKLRKPLFNLLLLFLSFCALPLFAKESTPKYEELNTEVFKNVMAKVKPEGVVVTWNIDYEKYPTLKDKDFIITYNTKIGAERHKEGFDNSEWKYTKTFTASTTKFEIKNLSGNEKYLVKIGFAQNGEISSTPTNANHMVWSDKVKFKTKRAWGIIKTLILIGSLVLFIYGMKIMSEGLQQAAGSRLRQMLSAITSNRISGVLSGLGITSVVQSSSVTTVMTVSFVNAGLLSLKQSAGVMMGANVGTTVTAWLILFLGFKVDIASYAYMILAFAGPLLFLKSSRAKSWAGTLIGFCILFIGLAALKDAVPELDENSGLVTFFRNYSDVWYGPLMFVLLGTLVTIIIQSSSAAMALTLTMVHSGLIPFEVACAMVLGENIGTTITAALAALIANVHAKRAARIHMIFNVFGVVWMLLLFPIAMKSLTAAISIIDGITFDPSNKEMSEFGIALFHTSFNIINLLILIWFIPQLVKFAERTIRSKGDEDEQFRLDFIGGAIQSPEISMLAAKKEVAKFGKIVKKMAGIVQDFSKATDSKKQIKLSDRIEKYEEITDCLEIEIADYLAKAVTSEVSEGLSSKMQGLLSITNDLERIGDILFQITKTIERKNDQKLWFTQDQRDNLAEMYALIHEGFDVMMDNLNAENGETSLDKAIEIEQKINLYRNKLRKKHLKTIGKEGYNVKSGMVYNNIFSSLEKIGDHLMSVSEAIVGEI